jgi:hypothetical protein
MLRVELEEKTENGWGKIVDKIRSKKSPWLHWQSTYGSIAHVAALTGNGVIVASLYKPSGWVEVIKVIKEREMLPGGREIVTEDQKHFLVVKRNKTS